MERLILELTFFFCPKTSFGLFVVDVVFFNYFCSSLICKWTNSAPTIDAVQTYAVLCWTTLWLHAQHPLMRTHSSHFTHLHLTYTRPTGDSESIPIALSRIEKIATFYRWELFEICTKGLYHSFKIKHQVMPKSSGIFFLLLIEIWFNFILT